MTQPIERRVLAVAHNVTAATRLLDVLPLVATDRRLQVMFTCPGSSPFTGGTEDFLTRRGALVVPWTDALSNARPDLAITASYGGDLHELGAPLIVIPHGMGYNKYAKSANQQISKSANQQISKSVFGLSADWLMHDGKLVPTVIVLSHDEQLDRLRAAVPRAEGAAAVVGDPCFDVLVASRPLRETYRQAFGVGAGQRLVVVASTWGPHSLQGRSPSLAARLATQLPLDRYRVVLALHPNIAAAHSRWQLDLWLADDRRAGVLVLPDEGLWRQAVVAADVVIGDHGSVTFYAAALGTPILLASAPLDAVDPRSPSGMLLAAAPRLRPHGDVLVQIEQAIDDHDPAHLAPITGLTTSHPGRADRRFCKLVYDLLDLAPPAGGVDDVLRVPHVPVVEPQAQLVEAVIESAGADELAVRATRYPAGDLGDRPPSTPSARPAAHLVVDVRATNTRLRDLADVVVHPPPPLDARRWIAETLRKMPGCAVATAPTGAGAWLAGTADGTLIRFDPPPDDDVGHLDVAHGTPVPPAVWASAVHAWLVTGQPASSFPGTLVVRVAGRRTRAHATVLTIGDGS